MTLQSIADRILDVLEHKPSGYFSDFDGVLSQIAPVPDAAIAYPGVQESLDTFASHLDAAGIITGRAAGDVATKLNIDALSVVGNHGLEWVIRGEHTDHPAGVQAIEAIAQVMDAVQAQHDEPGMIWENKRLSSTIHFRNVEDPDETEARLIPIVEPMAADHNLRMTHGKMIVELRPLARVNKGTALEELIERNNLQGVVFWGDDVTDIDGFRALKAAREAGKHTLSVGVVTVDAHPDIAANSDVLVASVEEAAEVFAMVAKALEERA